MRPHHALNSRQWWATRNTRQILDLLSQRHGRQAVQPCQCIQAVGMRPTYKPVAHLSTSLHHLLRPARGGGARMPGASTLLANASKLVPA